MPSAAAAIVSAGAASSAAQTNPGSPGQGVNPPQNPEESEEATVEVTLNASPSELRAAVAKLQGRLRERDERIMLLEASLDLESSQRQDDKEEYSAKLASLQVRVCIYICCVVLPV